MDAVRRSLLQAIPMLAGSSAFAADGPALSSFVKPYSELPVKQSGQNESRPILDGRAPYGDHLEVHETILGAGKPAPSAPPPCARGTVPADEGNSRGDH